MIRFLLLGWFSLYGMPVVAQDCNCKENFNYMIDKVEHNFIGFHDKVTAANEPAFHHLTDSLLLVADTASMPVCLTAMQQWLKFFKDRHTAVYLTGDSTNPLMQKYFPGRKNPAPLAASKEPYLKSLNDTTCLLAIPSAGMPYVKKVDSIIAANKTLLSHTTHFIIDIRNNRGGTTLVFEPLWPYLYTQPMITEGADVYATEENMQNYYDQYNDPNISDSMRNVFKKEAAALWAHKGTIYKLWNDDTLKLDQVLPYPKKVSVIINQNVASSAEMFLLKARQSSKVKLYGTNTIGAVDYADAVPYKMPCPILSLRISSSRNCRVPVQTFDYIGISPDISIPEEVKDWQQFVCEQRK